MRYKFPLRLFVHCMIFAVAVSQPVMANQNPNSVSAGTGSSGSLAIAQMDVHAHVLRGGTLIMRETIRLSRSRNGQSFVRRFPGRLPSDGKFVNVVYEDFNVLDSEGSKVLFEVERIANGTVNLKIGEAAANSERLYKLRYQLRADPSNSVRLPNPLILFVTGFHWDLPISASSFELSFPPTVPPMNVVALTNLVASVGTEKHQAPIKSEQTARSIKVLHAKTLQPGEGMVANVALPAGFWLAETKSEWPLLKSALRIPSWISVVVATLVFLQFMLGRLLVLMASRNSSDATNGIVLSPLEASIMRHGRLTRAGLQNALLYLAQIGRIPGYANQLEGHGDSPLGAGDAHLLSIVSGPTPANLPAFAVERKTLKQLARAGIISTEERPRNLLWKAGLIALSASVALAWVATNDDPEVISYAVAILIGALAILQFTGKLGGWFWMLLVPLTCMDRLGLYEFIRLVIHGNLQGFALIWPPLAAAGATALTSYVLLAGARETGAVFWQTRLGRFSLVRSESPVMAVSRSDVAEWKSLAAHALYQRPLPTKIGHGRWR